MHEDFQETHDMILVETHDSGFEEWLCPTCSRRFLMHWPPEYQKIILEVGDVNAVHSGAKGGMTIGSPSVNPEKNSDDSDMQSLTPWLEWMDKAGFDKLWDKPVQ